MGIFSELFFKTELSLNKGNNSWKAKQVQKVEKDIKKIKSNIEQLKGEIINREGQFEKLEKNLKSWVIKKRPDLNIEFEKFMKLINEYLLLFNKINELELKASLDNNPHPELKKLYDLTKAKKSFFQNEWKRIDQLAAKPSNKTNKIETTIIKNMRTLQPVIRKAVMDIFREFEEIETIQSSVKANVKSIQKLRKRINSLRGSRSFKPAYSH